MKKFLLLFISILSLSFLFNTNKANAQVEEFPTFLMRMYYDGFEYVQENVNTHEFYIYYTLSGITFNTLSEEEYFIVNDIGINFRKRINRNTNSYILIEVIPNTTWKYTRVKLHVTVTKTLLAEYGYPPSLIENVLRYIFDYNTGFFVKYIARTSNIDYDAGYSAGYDYGYYSGYNVGYNDGRDDGYNGGRDDGYNEGYNIGHQVGYNLGYDEGYNNGIIAKQPEIYRQGYEDGQKSTLGRFTDNFHIWFIPAIILVFVIGIFVAYRKERE